MKDNTIKTSVQFTKDDKQMEGEVFKSTVELYKVRGVKNGGWADITIDAHNKTGRISISSSHGDWAYYWGACGCPFKEFLIGLDIHYTAGKFGEGHHLDLSATIKEWKREVLTYRRQEMIEEDFARDLWLEIEEIESEHPDMEGVKYMLWNTVHLLRWFDSSPNLVEDIAPSFYFFWENIWPVFINEIRTELQMESNELTAEDLVNAREALNNQKR